MNGGRPAPLDAGAAAHLDNTAWRAAADALGWRVGGPLAAAAALVQVTLGFWGLLAVAPAIGALLTAIAARAGGAGPGRVWGAGARGAAGQVAALALMPGLPWLLGAPAALAVLLPWLLLIVLPVALWATLPPAGRTRPGYPLGIGVAVFLASPLGLVPGGIVGALAFAWWWARPQRPRNPDPTPAIFD